MSLPVPSKAQRGLLLLLQSLPGFDLLSVDWQVEPSDGRSAARWRGPWLIVELGQRSEQIELEPAWAVYRYAIWKETGAVYSVVHPAGPVSDDPILELPDDPEPS